MDWEELERVPRLLPHQHFLPGAYKRWLCGLGVGTVIRCRGCGDTFVLLGDPVRWAPR